MELDKETSEKIQELQILEQNIQSLALQRQAFDLEVNESEHALKEVKKSGKDDLFKIVGQIMIRSDKKEIEEDLNKKLKLLNLRLGAIEKQEKELSERSEELKKEVSKTIGAKK